MGLLQAVPRLRFNKEGNLLVVTTADNGFKVLANADGLRSLRAIENRSYEASRAPIEMKVVISFQATLTLKLACIFLFFLKKKFDLLFMENLIYFIFLDQVSTSAMVTNINPAINKVDRMDASSPARPTQILVCDIKVNNINCSNNLMTTDWLLMNLIYPITTIALKS